MVGNRISKYICHYQTSYLDCCCNLHFFLKIIFHICDIFYFHTCIRCDICNISHFQKIMVKKNQTIKHNFFTNWIIALLQLLHYCNNIFGAQLLIIAIINNFFGHYCYCYCNNSERYCQYPVPNIKKTFRLFKDKNYET